jgi:hypothetical protein
MSRSVFDPLAGTVEPVMIPVPMELMKEGLKQAFIMNGNYDAIIEFIIQMDLACADWDVTEKLIAHFKAMEVEMIAEEGCGPVEPKKITIET